MKHFAAAITVLLLTGCVSQYEATFPPSETSAEPVSLHVTPVLQQEELEVQVIIQDSSATAGQYGLIGALVGAAIDASINNSRAKKAERRAEVIRNNTINLDLYGQLADTTRIEAAGGTWELVAVDDVTTDIDLSPRINDILESGDVDAVVAMTASYKLTPALDQIAVRVVQAVYPRDGAVSSKGKRRPSSTRAFTYLSPQRPLQYRPFNDCEFERIEARIRDEYAQQISMEPGKADALTKAMEKEIEELAESGQIPEDIAMAETWGEIGRAHV